ncbi:MAG: cytochrome c3 family protein, partial [Planctomycetaceae bacterium]|nr:cytochrome c3 family protein [Planctomycetaceae bacterium]
RDQPVPFSHQHHVQGLGIDCRYCHTSVETSGFAGIPPTETCMSCHSQIWSESPMLEPVRASMRTNEPIRWNRVHELPDYAYFNHAIHVQKGIGCSSCHGRVDLMPLTWKDQPLTMEWCLGCHREPEAQIRPREEVFNMSWTPPANQLAMGKDALVKNHIPVDRLTHCYTCHR